MPDPLKTQNQFAGPEAWERHPEATDFFDREFEKAVQTNFMVRQLTERFHRIAGVRFQNLIDHWAFDENPEMRSRLEELGYSETPPEGKLWSHSGARLPRVLLEPGLRQPRIVIAVENLSDFIEANELPDTGRRGDAESGYEEVSFPAPAGEFAAIVRQGYSGLEPGRLSAAELSGLKALRHELRSRNREGDDAAILANCHDLAERMIELMGVDRAVDEFFSAERDYYLSRNSAARWQLERQQEIGIGWANHDHHTYRSSRALFRPLLSLWKRMGFVSRERFYAGVEAGWGAQVLEHPVSRVVLFCDVDMSPEELSIDFLTESLPPRKTLGTIGLWCGLHGDSIAKSGMHHLEAEFDFERTSRLLEEAGIDRMAPFTDLPMLKQAFTKGENWQVPFERIETLLRDELITLEQADRFLKTGATGSHLEILQRWEGFKGFNKTGIDVIIKQTDARN